MGNYNFFNNVVNNRMPDFCDIVDRAIYHPSGHKDVDSIEHYLQEYYQWCNKVFNFDNPYNREMIELCHYSNVVISRMYNEICDLKAQLKENVVSEDIETEILLETFEE